MCVINRVVVNDEDVEMSLIRRPENKCSRVVVSGTTSELGELATEDR